MDVFSKLYWLETRLIIGIEKNAIKTINKIEHLESEITIKIEIIVTSKKIEIIEIVRVANEEWERV